MLKLAFSDYIESLHLHHSVYESRCLHPALWPYARRFKDGLLWSGIELSSRLNTWHTRESDVDP